MLAGSLAEFSIPDIFSLLTATRKTGRLHLQADGVAGCVWIDGGAVAFAVADATRSPLAARMLHAGEVTSESVERIVDAQAGQANRIATALTDAGLSTDRVATVVRDAVVDAVFDLSRWPDGSFSFEATTDGGGAAVTVATAEVLAAVEQRLGEWAQIAATLPAEAQVLTTVPRPPSAADGARLQVSLEQWEILTLVDGRRSVQEIVAVTGLGDFVVGKVLGSLVAAGLITGDDVPPGDTVVEQRTRTIRTLEQRLLGGTAPADPPAASPHDNGLPTVASDAAPVAAEDESVVQGDDQHAEEPIDELDDEADQRRAMQQLLAAEHVGGPAPERHGGSIGREPDADHDRRRRELAALGIVEDGANGDHAAESTRDSVAATHESVVTRDAAVDADLLTRLIDGVKGG